MLLTVEMPLSSWAWANVFGDRIAIFGSRAASCASTTSGHPASTPPRTLMHPPSHSITSSARRRIEGGIVMPERCAVLRLTVELELRGRSTGSSATLAP